MKVSVIMCVYNTRSYIEAAVQSILDQTYDNWELVISDDGSTDGTKEWLQQFQSHPKIKLVFQGVNIGYVANKNAAIALSTGDCITQNDSDDVSSPTRLEKQVAIFQNNANIKIVGCGYHIINNLGTIYKTVKAQTDQVVEKYTGDYPFWFPPLMVRREVFDKIGLFISYFAGMGDDLYWTVKANEQYPIYCLGEALYYYRDNPTSITNVLDDDRKLIVQALLNKLLRQRIETGSDLLEKKDTKALQQLEASFLHNKKFMSEQYRVWAAKAVDKENWDEGRKLIRIAFTRDPFNANLYRTVSYYIRKRLHLVNNSR